MSTPGPGAYDVNRSKSSEQGSLNMVQVWGLGAQFPPTPEFIEATKVPGPKYDIVHSPRVGTPRGFSMGTGPMVPLTQDEIAWRKVPGPGHYNIYPAKDTQRSTHFGSGSLKPRFDMCYINPKTPGPDRYEIERAMTPRHAKKSRSAIISEPDSQAVSRIKDKLELIKRTPGVGEYNPSTGLEIGADNPARRRATSFGKSRGPVGGPIPSG